MLFLKLSLVICFNILCFGPLSILGAESFDYSYDDDDDYTNTDETKLSYDNVVTTTVRLPKLGYVRGRLRYQATRNRQIGEFFGLKYGSIDVHGDRFSRFQKAKYPQRNVDVFDATVEDVSSGCPSFPDLEKIDADERRGRNVDDCLTLSVFTPNVSALLPVMVYVHGEMLFDGSSNEAQPDYFLEKDVVLVTVNYRLAPFGFISTLTPEIPGNVALADIQMSLEWIRENIGSFGGNPGRITLFGQSGGATLIHALALSGKAEGLFQSLILQSGTALSPYFIDEDPLASARNLARVAMCPRLAPSTAPAATISNCLANLRTSDILRAFKSYLREYEPRGLYNCGGFKLAIGDQLGFLPIHPAALVNGFHYPMMAGIAKDAGAFIMSRFYHQLSAVRSRNITDLIDVVLKHTSQPRHFAMWRNLALEHIFSIDDLRNPTMQSTVQGLLELTNLILYRAPIIESMRSNSTRIHPTFLYSFDHRGQFHRYGFLDNPLPFPIDATLSDDNVYLFPYPKEVSKLNGRDMDVARQMVDMWTKFAQFNNPVEGSSSRTQLWPRVSNEYGPYVRISEKIEFDYHFGEGISIPNLYPEFRHSILNQGKFSTKPPSSKQSRTRETEQS